MHKLGYIDKNKMKEKILILTLSALVVVQFSLNFFKKDEGIPSYYKEQFKERQEEIDGLYIDLKETKEQIKLLEYELQITDSLIMSASKDELRDIANGLIRNR